MSEPEVITDERESAVFQPDMEQQAVAVREEKMREEPRRPQVVGSGSTPSRVQFERAIVKHTDEINELAGALALAQGAFESVDRTRLSRIQLKGGGGYTHEYETLADVIEATKKGLAENGLAVMQFPFPGQQTFTLRTMLAHKSGQWIYNDMSCQIYGMSPQEVGSAQSYLMRYARKAILGIAAAYDDDDGASASGPQADDRPRPAQRQSEQKKGKAEPKAEPKDKASDGEIIGEVVELVEKNGGLLVRLQLINGEPWQGGTRDEEYMKAARVFRDTKARIRVTTKPGTRAGHAPTIDEMTPVRR